MKLKHAAHFQAQVRIITRHWNDLSKVLFELWKKLLKRFILGRLTLPKVSIVIYVSKLLLIVCCKVSMMVFIIIQKNADTYFLSK